MYADKSADENKLDAGEKRDYSDALPIQSDRAVKGARDKKKVNECLRMHGIKTARDYNRNEKPYVHEYRIWIGHLEVIGMEEEAKNLLSGISQAVLFGRSEKKEIRLHELTFHERRAVKEASKAVYALGLSSAEVIVGILASGHTLIKEVNPDPVLPPRILGKWKESLQLYEKTMEQERSRTGPPVLGCDPEFILVSEQGKAVRASRYLDREGQVGSDGLVLQGHQTEQLIAELRPLPSDDPFVLMANLRSAMHLASRKLPFRITWRSGGMPLKGFPLGGHIHFSHIRLNVHLLRALDNYLAMPLVLAEGITTRFRRPRYGFLGDYRRQRHGGFEYRSLPSWLVEPDLTEGIFCLSALIASHYLELNKLPLQELSFQRAYYEGEKNMLVEPVKEVWSELENLSGYRRYRARLDWMKSRLLSLKPWEEERDVRLAWEIPPFSGEEDSDSQIML